MRAVRSAVHGVSGQPHRRVVLGLPGGLPTASEQLAALGRAFLLAELMVLPDQRRRGIATCLGERLLARLDSDLVVAALDRPDDAGRVNATAKTLPCTPGDGRSSPHCLPRTAANPGSAPGRTAAAQEAWIRHRCGDRGFWSGPAAGFPPRSRRRGPRAPAPRSMAWPPSRQGQVVECEVVAPAAREADPREFGDSGDSLHRVPSPSHTGHGAWRRRTESVRRPPHAQGCCRGQGWHSSNTRTRPRRAPGQRDAGIVEFGRTPRKPHGKRVLSGCLAAPIDTRHEPAVSTPQAPRAVRGGPEAPPRPELRR
jgi:hypothetical protein